MREIGGYFGLEQFDGQEYHSGLIALNTGRGALEYLVKVKRIQKLLIPFYLCDSVSARLDRIGCPYEFYNIGIDFKPVIEKELSENEWLYIVNYYGQLTYEDIIGYKEKFGRIIVDNVQAFFQKALDGVDTIYSCRKFFGVPDGAYLASDDILDEELENEKALERMRHLIGRFEGKASDFYSDFKTNDASFANSELMMMSNTARNILRAIDYDNVKRIREKNFNMLHGVLAKKNELEIIAPEGPFAYPFYCKNGEEVRKQLSQKGIYIATLWPNVLKCEDKEACNFAKNILPLPCDQRNGEEEMRILIDSLLKAIEENQND